MHSLTLPFQRVYLLALCAAITIAQSALDVPWSGKKYGPDGPWQAVKIKVGGFDPTLKIDAQNHADIDVYPGGIYNSFTFSKSACNPYPNSACGEGGTWDPDPSAMAWFSNFAQAWHPPLEDKSYGLLAGPLNYTQRALTIRDKTVWNASIAHSNMGNVTYFNGATSGMRLGFLALGAPETVQTFDTAGQEGKSNHNVTGNVYNGKLYEDKTIASYSYSLHIGSAAFEYPGSLVFGGYNKGRAIGPLTTLFEGEDRIDLLDIGIGVEHGDSPFDFDSKSGLLISDTGIVGDPQQVKIDPTTPYLSLPDNTCEGLASTLPIKYDQTSKHYHWQTDDPKYKKIVTSPAYLRFTFPPARGSTNNVTIKVPFALLNLTLETPIVDRPTQYFPCHSFNPLKRQPYPTPDDYFRLGRAFLQAAFISRNWATGTTWMGQAPGPGYKGQGLGDQIIDIEAGDTTLESWESAKTNYFNQSWEGHWSVIDSLKPQASSTDNTNTAPTKENYGSGGLSTGAKAGIGIGAAVVAMIAIGVGILLWRKRAREAGMSEKRASAPARGAGVAFAEGAP
ncbi:hypothetical protein CC80DRAFT_512130 [Byssothecium circinans]|uniref:Peptidase A1 domain-containing protein n=1 Tax=Byssothecium circinans TaxID=147558 RepID=A0A6A5UES9_9PLEO|nr:hypothetical protein CC80DRAFT_512130 [Byssothecium circinans]